MENDYEIADVDCPQCHHHETHSRPCLEMRCRDGWCDEYEDDPINFAPGEEYTMCQECCGTGIERWCPKCGCDLQRLAHQKNHAK